MMFSRSSRSETSLFQGPLDRYIAMANGPFMDDLHTYNPIFTYEKMVIFQFPTLNNQWLSIVEV